MPSSDSYRVRASARCEEPRRTHGWTPAPPPLWERPVVARVSKRQPPGALPRTGNPNPDTTMPQSERARRGRAGAGGGEEAHLVAGRLPPLTRVIRARSIGGEKSELPDCPRTDGEGRRRSKLQLAGLNKIRTQDTSEDSSVVTAVVPVEDVDKGGAAAHHVVAVRPPVATPALRTARLRHSIPLGSFVDLWKWRCGGEVEASCCAGAAGRRRLLVMDSRLGG
jgi:hypothetical protein